MKKNEGISPEEAIKQVQKIFRQRGKKALQMARREILQENIECKEAGEALKYFMTKYWQDLARPSLLSLVCEAVGGNPESTTPIAVPMILISGALDIHDDIIDRSVRKDGRPTVYGKFGKDIALLVGDALLFKGLTLLNRAEEKEVPSDKMRIITEMVKNMFFELGDAEALELKFRGRTDVSPEEYLRIVRKKAADVEAHTRISALLGGASSKDVKTLGKYGRLLGMLIILRDDWIDMVTFEESKQRIQKESLPLPLLYTLQKPTVKPRVESILRKKTITKEDARTILEIVQKAGGIEQYQIFTSKLARKAYEAIKDLRDKSKLVLLVNAMVPPIGEWVLR